MNIREAIATWVTPDARGVYIGPPISKRWRANRLSLSKHIIAAIGDADIHSLGAADIWKIQHHCIAAGLKPSSINHITHAVLRSMLRDLASLGLVGPAVVVRIGPGKKLRLSKDPRVRAYDEEQRDRALAAFRGHWACGIALFLFDTGCRESEMAGLQWRDVDLPGRKISIARARVGADITDCKNESSQRVIDMTDEVAADLGSRTRRGPGDFVFLGRHGKKPVDVHTLRAQIWKPTLAAAGLPALDIHGARHTWATIALTNGVPIAQVAAHLGNSERMVARVYAHVLPRFNPNEAMGRRSAIPASALRVVEGRTQPLLRLVKG